MITVDKLTRSPRYLIAESAVSFTENYQGVNKEGNPIYDVVAVSVSSEAAIMVFDENNGISYGDDLQYQRWRLNGVTTGLVSTEAHNIYARLNKEGKKDATIIFSVRNYRTDGSYPYIDEDGVEVLSEPSAAYYYILIGTLTALDSSGRTLTFDPGRLSTQQQQNEQGGGWVAEMFELVRDAENLIRAKLRFENLRVKGESLFDSIANFYKGIKIGPSDSAKAITSVATDFSTSEDATDAAATPAYVKAFSEGRYLSKTSTDPQSVAGPVTFEHDVTVQGNQTIEGEQEVKGLQTLHEGFNTANFNDAAGQITGAQLTSAGMLTVAGLKAMSFEVFELIYNVIRAQGGKMVLRNAATVESVKLKINGIGELVDTYEKETNNIEYALITIKEDEHNKGANPFVKGDILYGYVNSIGDSGKASKGGECTMWVDEVLEGMTVKAKLFTVDASVSSTASNYYDVVGSNIAPTAAMVLAQRGNKTDENRRTSIFLDGESGNIVMLQNVSTPRIKKEYYGTVNGILPTDIYNEVKGKFDGLNENSPVFYGEYGIFRNIIEFDHLGGFLQKERNRGVWSDVAEYENNARYYDVVTYGGQLWKCLRDNKGIVPTDGDDWLLLVSKGDDGTSIKVSGSFIDLDAFEAVWKPNGVWKEPEDHSQCYVVGQNLYVWFEEDRKWDSVGQFKGDKGDSVTGTTTQYAVNQSMTDKPEDAKFSDNYPTSINEGDVLWTRTKVNIENHSSDWSYSASRQAKNGAKGDGLKSITTQYSVTKDANQPDVDDESQWKETIESWGKLEEGDYVWTATVYDYDASENDEVSISVSRIAENGTSVTTTGKYYIVSDSGTEAPSKDADWQTTIPTVEEGKFLWTRIDFSDGENAYSVSKNGESVKVEEIKYSTKFTASQPSDSTFTVDEPDELVIPNGGFLWCRTTFSGGKKIYTKSYQGMDNTSVQWTIHTNTNTISVEDRGTAEGYVDVWVGKQTSQGYSEIKDSSVLANDGLKVMYYTDGHTLEATELTLEENELYTFGDNTELVLDNGVALANEQTIDLTNVTKSITFVLVKSNVTFVTDADIIASKEVLVMNPDYTLSIEWSNNIIGVGVDAQSRKVLEGKTYIVDGYIKYGGKDKKLSDVTLTIENPKNNSNVVLMESTDASSNKFGVQFTVPKDASFVNLPKYIEVKATLNADTNYYTTSQINIQELQRGAAGPMGEIGPMIYPSGTFDINRKYERLKDEKTGKVLATVSVFDGNNDYYILIADSSEGNALTNGEYWHRMQQYEAIYTKILMANFAKLASAVFEGRYMFSEYGVWAETNDTAKYDDEGVKSNIFRYDNGVPSLTGQFKPQLFLDFERGGAALGKLSEMFVDFPVYKKEFNGDDRYNFIHYMDLNRSHNVSIYPRSINDGGVNIELCGAVVLPNGAVDGDWEEDGTHATIVYQFEPNRVSAVGTYTPSAHPFVVVCADSRIFNNGVFNEDVYTNCFIWKGRPCKWIMMSHGQSLKVRSVKQWHESIVNGEPTSSYQGVNWIVENAADFEPINLDVTLQRSAMNKENTGIDTETIAAKNYDKPTDTNQTWPIALGGGLQLVDKSVGGVYIRQNESVYDESSIFIDLGIGQEYNIGAGSTKVKVTYVKVGLK